MIPFPEISPDIFSITIAGREFALRWYAMAYLAGLLIGWRVIVALMRRPGLWGGTAPMRPEKVEELLTWVVVGVILGGRLGFVLFYEPAWYLANPGQIIKVWQGGMSFHGGFLGVVLAAWAYARRNGIAPLRLADALAVAESVRAAYPDAVFAAERLTGFALEPAYSPRWLPGADVQRLELPDLLAEPVLKLLVRHEALVADDYGRSVIREQVEMGVAVRMACLETLSANLADAGRANL